MTTLQNLWYGNIRPNEDKVITEEEKELVELIARHHETLSSSLKNDDKIIRLPPSLIIYTITIKRPVLNYICKRKKS